MFSNCFKEWYIFCNVSDLVTRSILNVLPFCARLRLTFQPHSVLPFTLKAYSVLYNAKT